MRIAIPLTNGRLSLHFGFCECFALLDVDPDEQKILGREDVWAPPHQSGLLPLWLAGRGATVVLAGGMGERAQGLFAEQGIRVVVGAMVETPERIVFDYLAGTLQAGENVCDHKDSHDRRGEEHGHQRA
jgi:predicted Fe-Mo cluster-binding NifX family protein